MYTVTFSKKAQKDLKKISKDNQAFIIKKLNDYTKQVDPLVFSKPLVNQLPSTHRFRISKYRLLFHLERGIIYIDRAEIRGHAYRS